MFVSSYINKYLWQLWRKLKPTKAGSDNVLYKLSLSRAINITYQNQVELFCLLPACLLKTRKLSGYTHKPKSLWQLSVQVRAHTHSILHFCKVPMNVGWAYNA